MLWVIFIILRLFCAQGAMLKPVVPGIIIGGGRIGSFLHVSNNKLDILIQRNSDVTINEEGVGPIYVCTRNDDLENLIQ